MSNVIRSCLILLALVFSPAVKAETVSTPRTEARLITDLASVSSARPFWAVLHIKLKDGWHTYWKNPGDSGTSPILEWTLPSGFTAGEIEYIPPVKLETPPLVDYGYHDDAYYLIPIKPPTLINTNATIILMLKAQWLVCKDVCIPEKAELSAVLPVSPPGTDPKPSADAELVNSLVAKLPVPITEPVGFAQEGDNVTFTVKLPKALEKAPESVRFFPATDGIISNSAEQKITLGSDTIGFTVKKGESTGVESWDGVVSLFGAKDSRKDYAVKLQKGAAVPAMQSAGGAVVQASSGASVAQLAPALLFALLGGLILNLMPCVLPILSLKVLSVAKKAKSEAGQVRKQALAYTAGVVLSFMLLAALLIALQRVAGETLGWGFQMQSPVFVSFLSVLMLLVGLNLSGAFELPVLLGNAGGEAAAKDSAAGSFLTGVLAVLVATPCTAPFMAPAIGFALGQSPQIVLAVFAALGVGLALPFLLFSIFPSLANALPKPGAWMLTLKQFLAFPIYLTVVWLLWVLSSETGPNGVGMAMLAMVGAGFCIFLLQRESALAMLLAVIIAGASVAGIINYAKPEMRVAMDQSQAFSVAKLEGLRKEGKRVFVDATAQWCITCKVNETVALSTDRVRAAFKAEDITVLVADWTHGDEEITKYLQSFDRSGVPLYVYYPPNSEPKVLPQILTPDIVLEAIK